MTTAPQTANQFSAEQFKRGQKIKYAGFDGVVVRHYFQGLWEIRVPGGVTCVGASEFTVVN